MDNEIPGAVCPNCGHIERNTNARICPNCGAPLPVLSPGMAQQTQPPPVIEPTPHQPWAMSPDVPRGIRQKPDSGKKVVTWVLGGCALVALLVILGLLALCGVITI